MMRAELIEMHEKITATDELHRIELAECIPKAKVRELQETIKRCFKVNASVGETTPYSDVEQLFNELLSSEGKEKEQ